MPTTASSMVVMIIGSTRTTNDLCSVGQISGLVGVAPDLHCSAEKHEFDQYRGLTTAMPHGANSMPLGIQHGGLHKDH
jgi:hypothetical protein